MKKTAENHRARKNRKSRLVKALRRAAFTAFLAALLGGNAHAVDINGDMTYGTHVPAGTKLSEIFFQGTTSVDEAVLIFPNSTTFTATPNTYDQRLSVVAGDFGTIQLNADVSLTIKNNLYEDSGDVYGGAIDNEGTLSLTGTTGTSLIFENNVLNPGSKNAYGGAVSNRGSLTFSGLENISFIGNKAKSPGCNAHGGAIYNLAGATLTFTDIGTLTFSDNEAKDYGGAIYTAESLDFTGVETLSFTGNTAGGFGGGVYASSVSDLVMNFGDNVTFENNVSDRNGGGMFAGAGGDVYVTFGDGATLSGNVAGNGGAVFTNADQTEVVRFGNGATVVGNRAQMSGGAFATRTLIFGDENGPDGVTTVTGNWAIGASGGAGSVDNLTINGAATIIDNYSNGNGGAFYIEGLNSIATSTLNADGGDIVFSGNRSSVSFSMVGPNQWAANITYSNANSLYLVQNVDLQLTGDGNIYFDDPIASAGDAGNISLTKTGDGFVQFQSLNQLNNSSQDGGAVNVAEGTFRVAAGARFSADGKDAVFILANGATLAGGGSGAGSRVSSEQGFRIYGTISPDSAVLRSTNTDEENEQLLETNKFGTLTLMTSGSITLNGFEFVYDADTPVTDTTNSTAITGDLLVLSVPWSSPINLHSGTVELRGDLAEGYYRLISASNDNITLGVGTIPNAVLTATQDGGKAVEPRWTTEFVWGDDGADKTNIWLGTTRNTLIVTWTGNETNTWASNDGLANWVSSQDNGDGTLFSKTFYEGDFVAFSPNPGVEQTIAIDNGGVKVSGFEFGGEGTATFTGTGGITFVNRVDNPDLVKGNYLHLFVDSSILHKVESGTLVFQNGANGFTGVTAGGGTIAFNAANQLGEDGSGTGTIAFTGSAALRADATGMTLARPVTIANGTTATVNTQDNTFTLAGTITGTLGTLAKDGSGRLILTSVGSAYQNTLVTDGTFEIYYVQSLGTNGVNLVAATALLDFNLLADETYAGQITGNGSVYVRNQSFPSISILTLTNADNSYTGGTTVEAGTVLAITHAAHGTNAGSVGTGDIELKGSNSRLEIRLAEDGELANDISGDGLLNMDSLDKTLTLSGDSIHTGGVIIVNGSVVIGSATALGNGDAVLAGVNGSSLISNREQKIANTIKVTGTGTVLRATEHLTVAGTTRSFSLETGSSLTVNAYGANILAETDVEAVSGTTLTKTGTGTFQVSANSVNFSGTMNVNEGDFRLVDGKTFGNTDSILNLAGTPASASISGNGVFVGTTATLGGTIDPTGKKFASDGTETGSDIDTLWLRYGTAILNGFTLQYDAQDVTTSDLLQIIGQAQIVGGTINVRTSGSTDLAAGRYLVVNSSASITDGSVNLTDATLNDLVGLTLNGAAYTDFSPRGNFHLELENGADTASQIWLSTELNSLTMDWTGASGTAWNVTDGNWQSLQINGSTRATQFLGGDKVHLAGTPASPVTITLDTDVTVSGLVVGLKSNGTTVGDGDVTISGTGSISADASSAFGKYVNDSLIPTGKLEKYGTGTLTVANTGGNRFLDGTALHDGTIHLAATAALGATTGVADELEGFVYFATAGLPTESRTVEVAADVDSIRNHFRVTAGTDNTFRNLGALTISGVENNSANGSGNELGGAFFIGTGTALTFDVRADLTLSGNGYDDGAGPVVNDIYLMEGSTLNVDVADGSGLFIGSGILGDGGVSVQKGTIVLNGTGTAKSGVFQIAANSAVANTDVQSGRLRLADNNVLLANSESFTLAADAFLEGSGTVDAVDNHWINGIVTPDLATFTSGTDTVDDAEKIGVLRIQGGRTDFDGFTFQYDVVAANTTNNPDDTPNDLIQLASQDVYIHGGTIDFRTATGTGSLATGKYLVIDSVAATFMDTNGVVLDDSALNTVLSGQVNGTEFGLLGPRTTQEFYFGANNVANPDSQIWLEVQRNTLQVDFVNGALWDTTNHDWQSRQYTVASTGNVYANQFQNGDFVHFTNTTAIPVSVELDADVIVSGLTTGRKSDGTTFGNGNVTISGDYGITAKTTDANLIVGKYANTTDPQGFVPTGKLEKYGTGALAFANTGTNLFEEGIELYGGILSYNNASQLGVGTGKAISFKNAATLRADTTTYLNTDLVVDDGVTGTLHADPGTGMLIASAITGGVTSALNKTGAGLVQLETASTAFGGTTNVNGGTFRVLAEKIFGSDTKATGSTLNVALGGTIAGAGTFTGNSATISGTIDPTGIALAVEGNESGDVHAVLTLSYDTVTLDGFTLMYDAVAPNTSNDPGQTTNDLLQIVGETKLVGGTIDVWTQSGADLAHGRYLIVHADRTILDKNGVAFTDNAALNVVLTATLNGNSLADESPRGMMDFTLEDYNPTQSQIWLVSQINSLSMDWTGASGTWNVTDANWKSLQTSPDGTVRATQFLGGDKVHLAGTPASPVTITLDTDVTVSGLVVGLKSNGTTVGDGDVTISGTGSITADASSAFGKYVNDSLIPTGKLEKYGTGTLTVANTGGNLFEEGIELYGGILSYNNASQLGVGTGKAISFKNASTLRADTTTYLNTDLVVNDGVTGTLHAGSETGMLVASTITGGITSALNKTGAGLVQLETDSTAFGGTLNVNEGAFRVVDGKTFGAADSQLNLAGTPALPASLEGNGTFVGTTATIGGIVDPTDKKFDSLGSETGDVHAVLTLSYDTVTLDGFTLMFDADDTAGTKDLLRIEATTVDLVGGAVQFSSLVSGRHLIIDATAEIAIDPAKELDGIDNPNGVLTALNSIGDKIKNDTVRGRLEFMYGDGGNDKTQVWADAKRNSLTMRNVGTYFESLQGDDSIDGQHRARTLVNGDALVLTNNNTENPYVFNTIDWQLAQFAVEGDGDVEITGTGGLLTSNALTATEGDYVGITGPDAVPVTGKFVKTGDGTTIFSNTGTNVFQQGAEIDGGILDIRKNSNLNALYLNVGNTANGTTAILTGTGPITTTDGLTIASGSTLKPGGLSRYDEQNGTQTPSATFMNVTGDLTFEAGGIYSVAMTQYDDGVSEKFMPISDCVVVQNGTVTIVDGALLDVEFDYWNNTIAESDLNSSDSDYFTIIELVGSSIATDSTLFTLNESNLPIGVMLAQGWNAGKYRLWFTNDPTTDFETIGKTHNQKEIGRILDDVTDRRDAGLKDLVDHISNIRNENGDPDETTILKVLDHLAGDLHFNSLMTALSQPWRYSFRQLDRDRSSGGSCDPCTAACGTKKGKRQLWGETFGRYDDVNSDGNAFGYTVNRWGVAVGVDQRISNRAVLGFSFDYSNPILRQSTGRTDADNYGFGGYGLVRLNDRYDLKFYAGYSHQSYDIDRNVFIPETNRFAALSERFRNSTGGDTFATSLELSRTFKLNRRFSLAPLAALDYEKTWMDGYRESGGLTALEYGRASLERFIFRFGLNVDYKLRRNLELNARIQYGTQLNDKEYAFGDVRFVNSTLADPMSGDIHGVRLGRDYLNLGIGADWKLNTKRDVSLFVNYDADIYRRATMHVGQVGLVLQW